MFRGLGENEKIISFSWLSSKLLIRFLYINAFSNKKHKAVIVSAEQPGSQA
jgi:hypothetical protein